MGVAVVARFWSRYGLWVHYSILSISGLAVLVTLVDPGLRSIDAVGGPIFVSTAIIILLTLLLLPQMGKAEFRRRYRGVGAFLSQYLRQCSPWIPVLHAVFFAIGLWITVSAFATAPQHSTVAAGNGVFFVLQDTGKTAISARQYDLMSAALKVWYPVGAAILLQVPVILFHLADRFIGVDPGQWTMSRNPQGRNPWARRAAN